MEEIPNSKVDVKLFRRFPDEGEKEVDYGPGYLKLYAKSGQLLDADGSQANNNNNDRAVQVVFRHHGTMKVRANHFLRASPSSNSSNNNNNGKGGGGEDVVGLELDTSYENELRYVAVGDVADMVPGSSGVYGKEVITKPQTFPVSYEFESEDIRDDFVKVLMEQLGLVVGSQRSSSSAEEEQESEGVDRDVETKKAEEV